MKIRTSISVAVERADGSYTETTDSREYDCGDNPAHEAAECAHAIAATAAVLNRRIEGGSGRG